MKMPTDNYYDETANKFNYFDGIDHLPLQAFNRAITLTNLREDFGDSVVKEYLNPLDETARRQLFLVLFSIQKMGLKETQAAVTRDLVLADERELGLV